MGFLKSTRKTFEALCSFLFFGKFGFYKHGPARSSIAFIIRVLLVLLLPVLLTLEEISIPIGVRPKTEHICFCCCPSNVLYSQSLFIVVIDAQARVVGPVHLAMQALIFFFGVLNRFVVWS